jgi:hypothetical protein
MLYTKEQIVEFSKTYFDGKPMLPFMYATLDNQFFYPESKSYAYAHGRSNNVEVVVILRTDVFKPDIKEVKEVKEIKPIIEEVIEEKKEIKKSKKNK